MKTLRLILWGLVALTLLAALMLGIGYLASKHETQPANSALSDALGGVGGPFTLQNTKGKVFTEKNLQPKPTLMFFGFTRCPDVCPTTLADITGWLQKLGKDADKLNAVFVTVDPERDTAEALAHYLTMFDPHIIGLTGSPAQLAAMAKNYKIFYQKTPTDNGNYTMDHTASIYLLDKDAKLTSTIAYRENEAAAFEKIRRLITGQ